MAKRKAFALRIDPRLYEALRKWSDDEFRSVNGQIEYLLRRAVVDAGRWPSTKSSEASATEPEPGEE
ncbi:MAG: hypothetical protein AAGE94_08975 [Acidobacteriota bacterium]